MQTACKISPAAPFEKCSLLSSPVLCHSSLWAVVCKMERQLHDLVLLIKASTLTVYLQPTLVLLCIYNSLDYIVKGNTQIWKNLYQKIRTGKTTKKIGITRISSCNTYRRNHRVLTEHLGSVEANAQHMLSANFFWCTKCCSVLLLYNSEPYETHPVPQVY